MFPKRNENKLKHAEHRWTTNPIRYRPHDAHREILFRIIVRVFVFVVSESNSTSF